MEQPVVFEKRDRIAVLSMNNPPVNGLGHALRSGLMNGLQQALSDDGVDAVVITGAGRMFSAGADIREFGKPAAGKAPSLRDVIEAIENAPKPFVAAIHGVAAGGGLELALGCHHRLAASGTRLGLPEVTLGLLPGAGGTQRLPRLVGVQPALEMIVAGSLIPTARAADLGLVDSPVEDDVIGAAVSYATEIAAGGRPPRKTSSLDSKVVEARGNPGIFSDFRTQMARRARGFEAPYACVDCVEAAVDLPFDEGLRKERELFAKLVDSEQSRAQRHVFFAEREVAKIPDLPADAPVRPIETAAVIGAGTMGGGIAMNFANAGIPVSLLDTAEEPLQRGLETIRKNYASTVSRGRLSQADMDKRMALITGTTRFDDIKEVDLVIEAVFEEMDLKKKVFAQLDALCKADAILATNTSTLDVNEIAAATGRPDKVMGTHFFSPANVMRLLENVRGEKTSHETLATIMKLSKTIGKVGVLVGVCHGFVGNRMLAVYAREANFLIEEGALPYQVDKVIYDFGFPMGPFAMNDLAGLDVGWRIRKAQAATRPTNLRYSPVGDKICEMGRFGQKTGGGWYRYEAGSRTSIRDPEIEQLIIDTSAELGIERREIGETEILERCMYPLINEATKILEEGIALRALDIDIIYIYGYGFPRYRGGPCFYADSVGLNKIHDTMQALHEEHGEWLRPAPLLEELAKSGKGFGDL